MPVQLLFCTPTKPDCVPHFVQVIYAQTDSVFVRFKGASIAEAIDLGHQASAVASAAFPPPISLKFERVLSPFLLLQVNRYAGRQFTSAGEGKGQGTLFVKGIEVDRRWVIGSVSLEQGDTVLSQTAYFWAQLGIR